MDFNKLYSFAVSQQYNSKLRPYQWENKLRVYEAWGEGYQNVMLQMPTGTGKTHLFVSIIKDIFGYCFTKNKSVRVLVLVHRKELIDQIVDTLEIKYRHPCGRVQGGQVVSPERNVIVASVQTLSRRKRLSEWEDNVNFEYIIIDEAHHSLANSYVRIRDAWPDARLLGVTATPYRLTKEPFTDVYDKLIVSKPVSDFIKRGYLCEYEYYSIRPDSELQKKIEQLKLNTYGDYDEDAMDALLNKDSIRASILHTYERYAKGKKGIIYTFNRNHNEELVKLFCAHGYNAVAIDSETEKDERDKVVRKFRNGEIDIIFNVNIFSEGFDCPDVEFIELARPTKSLGMYLQQVGRGLRTSEGKDKALFLDTVGLYNRFGLPSAKRNWQHFFERTGVVEFFHVPMDEEEKELHFFEIEEGNEPTELIYSSKDEVDEENGLTVIINGMQYNLNTMSKEEQVRLFMTMEDFTGLGLVDKEKAGALLEKLETDPRQKEVAAILDNTEFSLEDWMEYLNTVNAEVEED